MLATLFCFGQTKDEYEQRIKQEQFPEEAIGLLNEFLPHLRSPKYYSEKDEEHLSYEVKFKHDGRWHSIEFSPNGDLEDIEVEHPGRDINGTTFTRIKDYLDANYQRWKIEKIQFQYLPDGEPEQLLKDLLDGRTRTHDMLELIVRCKKGKSKRSFEMLFKPDGSFVKKREVIHNDHDFLSF
jgi:hypothetical protein